MDSWVPKVRAIVAYPPNPTTDLRYEEVVTKGTLKDHELLIKMVASGICHLEIHLASLPKDDPGAKFPRILGHEGAGYVAACGAQVTCAQVGDPVLLSYDYCGSCKFCSAGQTAFCISFAKLNMAGDSGDNFTTLDESEKVHAKFFGQSSFASLSIVSENCVLRMNDLLQDPEELKLFSPLGCGFQTGAGAVAVTHKATANDVVVVGGAGAVGLGAVMAAKIAGCKAIVIIDQVQSRLDVARSIGATHILNTTGVDNISGKLNKLLNSECITLTVETTGVPSVIDALVAGLGHRGRHIQIGISREPTTSFNINVFALISKRAIIEGNCEGGATSSDFIPKMIQWYREGKFPFDKLVKMFPATDVAEAVYNMENGSVIKPILVW